MRLKRNSVPVDMPELTLQRLRTLRTRAGNLLSHVAEDLRPFRQTDDLTFRRKPDSRLDANDVNVTTSCSCLMALALTDKLEQFYAPKGTKERAEDTRKEANFRVAEAFAKLVGATWMSSGLTENNAFTTTLVLRLLGFLHGSGVFQGPNTGKEQSKPWALNVGIANPDALAETIFSDERPVSAFLRQGLTDSGRTTIERWLLISH